MTSVIVGPDSFVLFGTSNAAADDNAVLKPEHADVTGSVLSISVDTPMDLHDITPLGVDHHAHLKGLEGGTLSMEVLMEFGSGKISTKAELARKQKTVSFLRWGIGATERTGAPGSNWVHPSSRVASDSKPADASGTNPYFDYEIHVTDAPISGGGTPGDPAKQTITATINKAGVQKSAGAVSQAWV